MRNAKSMASFVVMAIALTGCTLVPSPSPEVLVGESESDTPGGEDAGATANVPAPSDAGTRSEADSGSLDEAAILAIVASGAFRSSDSFVHATGAPYPSAAVAGSMIDEWVSSPTAADYEAISPDAGGPATALPVGSIIVREVIADGGVVTEMTVLVKGPAGYNPAIGDWWWGVTDGNGSPLSEDGGVLVGRLTQCYSCHLPRSGEDFLFGVPAGDK
jgi:hypothetical protein